MQRLTINGNETHNDHWALDIEVPSGCGARGQGPV